MTKRTILILSSAVALTTACTFGPTWTKPQMPVPEVFRGAGVGESSMADLPWQSVLHDSNLQALLQAVFENNRSLESLQYNVAAARQYVTVSRASLFPWVGYGASSSKGMNSAGGASVVQGSSATTNPGAMQLNASWELDLWGRIRKTVESSQAQADQVQEEFNNLRVSLLKQVACGYLQLLMLDEQLKITQSSVESYRDSLKLFNDQFENGVADGLQIATAQAALSAAEAEVPSLEMQIAELENVLSTLAGRMPGHIARSGSLQTFVGASKVAAGIPAEVISRRPDIRAKEQALRAANAEIGVAIANYFPSISLTGAAGYASMDLRTRQYGKNSGWGIGASLTGPLFQGGMLRATERAKRDLFLAAKSDYEQAVLSAMAEISTTLVQREKLQSVIANQEKAVAAYEESVKLAKTRYQVGQSAYFEVLDNQLRLFPAQKQLVAYRYQFAAIIPTLYTQLGGGWKE